MIGHYPNKNRKPKGFLTSQRQPLKFLRGCFYLLKIPSEVQQISKLSELRRPEHPSRGGGADLFHVKMQKAEELGEESMYNACPACHMIFEEGQDVVKCGNPECTAMYHFNCFEKLEDTRCSNCGVELRLT